MEPCWDPEAALGGKQQGHSSVVGCMLVAGSSLGIPNDTHKKAYLKGNQWGNRTMLNPQRVGYFLFGAQGSARTITKTKSYDSVSLVQEPSYLFVFQGT